MKLGFLLARKTNLKTMGALIQEAINDGHEIVLFALEKQPSSGKTDQDVDLPSVEPFTSQSAKLLMIGLNSLDKWVKREVVNVLITQEGFHSLSENLGIVENLRTTGTKVISLSHFYEIAKSPMSALDYFDQTFYLSEFARDLHFRIRGGFNKEDAPQADYRDKHQVVGSPMFDQLTGLDNAKNRAKHGVLDGQKVVLLMMPVIEPTTPRRYLIWSQGERLEKTRVALREGLAEAIPEIWLGQSFKGIYEAILDFCERSNALLVVKSRSKQNDPDYIEEGADVYLDGSSDTYYPHFTSYELMSFSNLCISANSMSIPEAVAVGVPCINIYVPHKDFAVPKSVVKEQYYDGLLDPDSITPFNYPGCVTLVDRRRISGWLDTHRLEDISIDQAAQKDYVKRFLGIEEGSASRRVLETLGTLMGDLIKETVP